MTMVKMWSNAGTAPAASAGTAGGRESVKRPTRVIVRTCHCRLSTHARIGRVASFARPDGPVAYARYLNRMEQARDGIVTSWKNITNALSKTSVSGRRDGGV